MITLPTPTFAMIPHTASAILTAALIGTGVLYKERKNKKLGVDQQVIEYIATLSTTAAIAGTIAGALLLMLF